MFEVSPIGGDGLTFPMNVFFKFEIERFNNIEKIMNRTLRNIREAIRGEIIMTSDLSDAILNIYNQKIPNTWLQNTANEEISWLSGSLSAWYTQFELRYEELKN